MKSLPYIALTQAQINAARYADRAVKDRVKPKRRRLSPKYNQIATLIDVATEEAIKTGTVIELADYILTIRESRSLASDVRNRILTNMDNPKRSLYGFIVVKGKTTK